MKNDKVLQRVFRSNYDRKGYKDPVKFWPEPIVSTEGYESLESIVAKCIRGEIKPKFNSQFTVPPDMPSEKAIDEIPSELPGDFDLTDAKEVLSKVSKKEPVQSVEVSKDDTTKVVSAEAKADAKVVSSEEKKQ